MLTELRTLDAINLATALLWKAMTAGDLTMATHDDALGIAAKAHGSGRDAIERSRRAEQW